MRGVYRVEGKVPVDLETKRIARSYGEMALGDISRQVLASCIEEAIKAVKDSFDDITITKCELVSRIDIDAEG